MQSLPVSRDAAGFPQRPRPLPWRTLSAVAEAFLEVHLFEPAFAGQVLCASEVLDHERRGEASFLYLWVLCAEFYPTDAGLQMGTAVSEPLMIYLLDHEGKTLATGFAEPRSGDWFAEDIQRIFTPMAIKRMCLGDSGCNNDRIDQLEDILAERVEDAS